MDKNQNITKADIVQRLLNDKHVTATEAVLLLSNNEYEMKPTWSPFNPWFGILSPPTSNPYTITATTNPETNKNK